MKLLNILLLLFNTLFVVDSQIISEKCTNCMNRRIMGENIDCFNDCNNDNYITNQDCSLYTHCGNEHQLIKQGDTCYCEDYIDCNEYFCTSITEINTESKLISYTTYELSLLLIGEAKNIYILYGDEANNMIIPEAFQVNQFAGTNIGGINDILLKRFAESKYDSWLTIQITDGNIMGRVATIGIDYSTWDISNPLIVDNGALFLEDPQLALSDTNKYVISHLTLSDFDSHQVIVNVQGKTDLSLEYGHNPSSDTNYRVTGITFNINRKNNLGDSH